MIGTICLWNFSKENRKAELGYELHPGFQGRGFMQEAVSRLITFGFHELGLETIEAFTHKGNKRSLKLLKKNNFRKCASGDNKLNIEVMYILANKTK